MTDEGLRAYNWITEHTAAIHDLIASYAYTGSLGASAWVVASDAPAAIKSFAALAQTAGYPVWVCDGINDDVEIQAAIDTLSGSKGQIYLTPGTFNTSSQIVLPVIGDSTTGVIITGAGWGATLINYSGTGYAIYGSSPTYTTYPTIENLRIYAANGGGIYLYHTTYGGHPVIRNVYVGDILSGAAMAGIGIYIKGCHEGSIENAFIYACSTGLKLEDSNAFSVRAFTVQSCTVDGVQILNCISLHLDDVVSQDNARYGLMGGDSASSTSGAYASVFTALYIENNGSNAIEFSYGNWNVSILSPYLSLLSGKNGISIPVNGGSSFFISGMYCGGGVSPLVIGAGAHNVVVVTSDASIANINDSASDTIIMGSGVIKGVILENVHYISGKSGDTLDIQTTGTADSIQIVTRKAAGAQQARLTFTGGADIAVAEWTKLKHVFDSDSLPDGDSHVSGQLYYTSADGIVRRSAG